MLHTFLLSIILSISAIASPWEDLDSDDPNLRRAAQLSLASEHTFGDDSEVIFEQSNQLAISIVLDAVFHNHPLEPNPRFRYGPKNRVLQIIDKFMVYEKRQQTLKTFRESHNLGLIAKIWSEEEFRKSILGVIYKNSLKRNWSLEVKLDTAAALEVVGNLDWPKKQLPEVVRHVSKFLEYSPPYVFTEASAASLKIRKAARRTLMKLGADDPDAIQNVEKALISAMNRRWDTTTNELLQICFVTNRTTPNLKAALVHARDILKKLEPGNRYPEQHKLKLDALDVVLGSGEIHTSCRRSLH